MKAVLLLLAVVAVSATVRLAVPSDLIDYVNSHPSASWRAGVNSRWLNVSFDEAAAFMGTWLDTPAELRLPLLPEISDEVAAAIPDSFDSREQWGTACPSTAEIRDQANCGSCWAFGAAEAMTDRLCIATNGSNKAHLSAADLNSCCSSCGMGCNGGYPSAAWSYWVHSGLVSGGNYGGDGCFPYQLPNCDHHTTGKYGPCPAVVPTPACTKTCKDGKDWNQDKHFGTSSYGVPGRVADIQNEIMNHGPLEAAFSVYQDFLTYKSGVYHHTTGSMLGGHAVKILGWGVDGGLNYWLVANSWNEDWGDQGYFKIRRGGNECGIEGQCVAGLPKTP
jgi:cathepsin B